MMYKAIRVSGADCVDFLQGQLTQDVSHLQHSPCLPAAWCSPKGRVIVTLQLVRHANGAIDLIIPSTMIDSVSTRLAMYRLRSKVQIEPVESDWTAMAISGDDDFLMLKKHGLLPGTRLNDCKVTDNLAVIGLGHLGCIELYGSRKALERAGIDPARALNDTQWTAARVEAGLPDIDIRNSEKYTPHMLSLDRIGAVSFSKGCYTGQEVVARTEHLGESKRRLMRYRLPHGTANIGDAISDGERDVGTVVNVGDGFLLAVTPVAVHEQDLLVNGARIEPAGLSYE